jgi:DNA primase
MIGAVGRAHDDRGDKWTNSKGFNTGSCLYNYHKAFDTIKALKSVVLVEGQGDVIRMYEAGIINCVGLFSCKLTDRQAILLEEASVDTIYLALDNDEAGKKGRADILEKFSGIFNIRNLTFSKSDVGEMSPELIQEEIIPQIKKA